MKIKALILSFLSVGLLQGADRLAMTLSPQFFSMPWGTPGRLFSHAEARGWSYEQALEALEIRSESCRLYMQGLMSAGITLPMEWQELGKRSDEIGREQERVRKELCEGVFRGLPRHIKFLVTAAVSGHTLGEFFDSSKTYQVTRDNTHCPVCGVAYLPLLLGDSDCSLEVVKTIMSHRLPCSHYMCYGCYLEQTGAVIHPQGGAIAYGDENLLQCPQCENI